MKTAGNIIWMVIGRIATLFLGMTLLIPYIPPLSPFNIFSSMNLLFPYALFFTFVCGIICLVRKQFYFSIWIAVVLLLSIPNVLRNLGLSGSNTTNDGNTLSISSYNVHYFNFYETQDKNALSYLKNCQADILCLQEVLVMQHGEHTLKQLCKEFSNYPYQHIYFFYVVKNTRKGVATFSKYPIVQKETALIDSKSHGAISSLIQINNDTLQVINCYLESNRLTREEKEIYASQEKTSIIKRIYNKLAKASQKRGLQAEAVVKMKKDQYPTLLCGDVNDVPTSYVYRTLRGDDNDCFLDLDWGIGNTFHEGLYHFRIDYIFADDKIEPLSFQVNKQPYSDHYPIELQCKIK